MALSKALLVSYFDSAAIDNEFHMDIRHWTEALHWGLPGLIWCLGSPGFIAK